MADLGRFDERDAVTAHDLREQGSLKWTRFGGDTIGAFVAEMDFGTAPAVVHALREAVGRQEFGYLPPRRAAELARACAAWQREQYGWPVAPEQILPVSDVLTALAVELRHFTRPGSPIILPTPAYMPFLTVPELHGREVRQVPMVPDRGRYGLDLDGIDRALRAGGQLVILCNPANPVGRVLTRAELTALTAVVDRHGGRVFADEVHAPLTYPGHHHIPYAATSATAAAHTLTATSASKAWNLPGLRCAQVIVAPDRLAEWRRVGGNASVAASTLGAIAGTAAYRFGGAWLKEIGALLDRNRHALGELLAEHLPEVAYHPPEGTYLAWLDCRRWSPPPERSYQELFLERAGVAVVDGADCGTAGAGWVRLNFATPLPILRRAVTRMARARTRST